MLSTGIVFLHDNARLDGQQVSCRSSAGRCLIIHPTARISLPVISIFSYTSRNSISVLRIIPKLDWDTLWNAADSVSHTEWKFTL
jgi:hypothetical protein